MNSCALDMLHDARNQIVSAVADGIYFHFNAHHVFVNEHRIFNSAGQNDIHIFFYVRIAISNDHILPAQHVRRSQQYRITQIFRCFQRFIQLEHRFSFRTGNFTSLQQFIEAFSVFCFINTFCRCAQNMHAGFFQMLSQADGGLSAELYNGAPRFFRFDNGIHIFWCQRIKVKPVRSIKVCGYCFWIVVNNNGLIAFLFQRPHAMHRAIVELNPLANTNRARTEYNNFLFTAVMFLQKLCCFILFIEGRIKIRCFRFEFCSAGIYHFIGGKAFFRRVFSGQTHDSSVQKAHLFGFQIQFRCQLFFHQLALHFHKILQFGQEPFVNLRDIMDFRQLDAPF